MTDYISREAAIEEVREKLGCETCNGRNVGIICTFCNVGEAILMIKNIPAADVEPVRPTGRWIKDGDFLICSVCEAEIDIKNSLGADNNKDYCPCCGAKMCLEDNDES